MSERIKMTWIIFTLQSLVSSQGLSVDIPVDQCVVGIQGKEMH